MPIRGHEAVGRLFLRVHTWWALRFHKPNDRSGHLFGSRFRSCLLDSAHYLATVRYIDLNPQAAGMVADPLTDEIDPYLELMMANWRYRFSNDPRRYREFLRETRREEQARIERALRNGFPLGSEEWVGQLEQESHRRLHPAPPGRQPVTWFTA